MWTRSVFLLGIAAALGAAFVGCGGGGDDGPRSVTVDLTSSASQQRSLSLTTAYTDVLACGDRDDNPPTFDGPRRAFLSFDLSALPAGVTITEAILAIRQADTTGEPFTDLGSVVVDHVEYGSGFPAPSEYDAVALSSNIGTLTATDDEIVRTLIVTAQTADDLANARTRSQFRLRFSPLDINGDTNSDVTHFEGASNLFGTGEVPLLIVTYTP